ncbi:MAG: hypothetical protein RL698_565 [Pseudomonadota bacterium]|jgi:penicillin-binding protein 1B
MRVRDEADDFPAPRRRRGRGLWLLVLLGLGVAAFQLDRRVVEGFGSGRCRDRVRVYAAPLRVPVGTDVDAFGIEAELAALGYRRVEGPASIPGTWSRDTRRIDVFLRAAPRPGAWAGRPAARVSLRLDGTRVASIDRDDGGVADAVEFDPRPLDGVLDEYWSPREPFRIRDAPTHAVDAVLAAEDARFLAHPGIDIGSLLRALRVNWAAGGVRQGGSTITQQVVKNHFLSQERTFLRKLREIPMTLALEWRFGKREILECYLATVYLGHDGVVGVHGLAEASRVYFGKPVAQLSVGESATLAGMIRSPNTLSPLRHPQRAAARRDQVIGQMLDNGWINAAQAAAARAEPLAKAPPQPPPHDAFFVQQMRRDLAADRIVPESLASGSAVFTTLDLRLQRAAEAEVGSMLRRLEAGSRGARGVQVAVVGIDPRDGAVRALVGGRDYRLSQLDHVVQTRRPLGTLFQPFVYLAALADPSTGITPASRISDAPLVLDDGGREWRIEDAGRVATGKVGLREALAGSLVAPQVRVARSLGARRLAEFGGSLPLGREPLPEGVAAAVGSFEASLLDAVASFAVFPSLGRVPQPHWVEAVKTPGGSDLLRPGRAAARIANPAPAYVAHALLADVAASRSTSAAHLASWRGASEGGRDAWWVGWTPSLVLGVWVGFDDDRPMPDAATAVAAPLGFAIANGARAGLPGEAVVAPEGVETAEVDEATGLRFAPGCAARATLVFVSGTAPRASCRPPAVRGEARPRAS